MFVIPFPVLHEHDFVKISFSLTTIFNLSTQCHPELWKSFPLLKSFVKSKLRVFSHVKHQVISRLTTLGRKMARFQLVITSSWWITVSSSRHGIDKIMGSMCVTLQTALDQQSIQLLCFLLKIIKMMRVNIPPKYSNILKCFPSKSLESPELWSSVKSFGASNYSYFV